MRCPGQLTRLSHPGQLTVFHSPYYSLVHQPGIANLRFIHDIFL
jgi:hypothetical protein